jgi:hypothetical protein
LYALAGALAHRANRSNADKLFAYTGRMPPEFEVLVVRDATMKCAEITETKAFVDWSLGRGAKVLLG